MPNSASSQTAYDYLITLFTQSQDKAFITEVMAALLTEKEQKEIANRIQIFSLFHHPYFSQWPILWAADRQTQCQHFAAIARNFRS